MSIANDVQGMKLGLTPLTVAFVLSADIIMVFGLTSFILTIDQHPRVWVAATAWAVLLVTMIVEQTAIYRAHWQVPRWAFTLTCAAVTVVVLLDAWATWGARGAYPAAAVACGSALLVVATVDKPRELLVGTALIGTIVIAILISQPHESLLRMGNDLLVVGMTAIPPLAAIIVTKTLRRLITRQLDRAQVEATANAPALSAGLLSSEELEQLDLNTERLLQGVGDGRYALPLPDHLASSAAALATKLRLNLVDGRRETWLYHAVTESTLLGPAVTLTDPHGLAGKLGQHQRNALLSAVWLLVGGEQRPTTALEILFDEADDDLEDTRTVRISIVAEGLRSTRVDPEAWSAIVAIGNHVETVPGKVLHVDIECPVDATNDYETAHQPTTTG